MSNYQDHWDLSTIPDAKLNSEVGRRRRSKAPAATYSVIKPCDKCGVSLNTTERRKPCPNCGYTHPRSAK